MADQPPRDPFDIPRGERARGDPQLRGTAIRPPTTADNFSIKGNHLQRVEETV